MTVRVPLAELTAFVRNVLTECGLDADSARTAADVITYADANGFTTHGTNGLVNIYAPRLLDGRIDSGAAPRIVQETAGAALLDGDRGLGLVTMDLAMDIAMAKARQTGIGMVAVRNSTHFGSAGLLHAEGGRRRADRPGDDELRRPGRRPAARRHRPDARHQPAERGRPGHRGRAVRPRHEHHRGRHRKDQGRTPGGPGGPAGVAGAPRRHPDLRPGRLHGRGGGRRLARRARRDRWRQGLRARTPGGPAVRPALRRRVRSPARCAEGRAAWATTTSATPRS